MDEEARRGCGGLFGKLAELLPCSSWRWRPEPGEESGPILHPPTGNLAECLIPPSAPGLYGEGSSDDLRGKERSFSRGNWEVNAGRGPLDSPPHTPRTARQRKTQLPAGGGDSPGDRQGAAIELKEASANPLLGQFHLEGKGQFVRDKLPALQKPSPQHITADARSEGDGLDSPPLLDLDDQGSSFDPIEDDLT